HRVHVGVQHNGNLALVPNAAHAFEDTFQRRAGRQGARAGELVHDSVGERIAEGDADLHEIHARTFECGNKFTRGTKGRVAAAQVGDESGPTFRAQPGECGVDAICGHEKGATP